MKEITACFTGHRKITQKETDKISNKLESEIESLVQRGITCFKAGGALGFDMMAEEAVLKMKSKYPWIKLTLILPCRTQTQRWAEENKNEYENIKNKADEVVYVSEEYTSGCMYKRNRRLIDESNICICYLISEKGGTAYTVEYARKAGIEIINIAM